MKKLLFFILFAAFYILAPVESDAAINIFASVSGGGNGLSKTSPTTLTLALSMAKSGDTIGLLDGVYVSGRIVLPVGISLTSVSQDASKVIIKPNANFGEEDGLLRLTSTALNTNGSQKVSYITFDGMNGANRAATVLLVKNRNNVAIEYNRFENFQNASNVWSNKVFVVESTAIARTNDWWNYVPQKPKEPTDANYRLTWPSNPIENFNFNHNTIVRSGTMKVYNWKNSSVTFNEWDSTGQECISGVNGFLDNVDIGYNKFFGTDNPDNTNWRVEVWLSIGGTRYHDNVLNGYFSVTNGHSTKVYNNTIIKDPPDSGEEVGIEFNVQTDGEVYNNFISGSGGGVFAGIGHEANIDTTVRGTIIRNNIFYDIKKYGVKLNVAGGDSTLHYNTVENMNVYNNVVDGQTSAERVDDLFRGNFGVYLNQAGSNSIMRKINVKNNVVRDLASYAIYKKAGVVSELSVMNNQLYNNKSISNVTHSGTDTADPKFEKPGGGYLGYILKEGSPCIDTGIDVGIDFNGSTPGDYNGLAPDRGAIESGASSGTPPAAPGGLTVK